MCFLLIMILSSSVKNAFYWEGFTPVNYCREEYKTETCPVRFGLIKLLIICVGRLCNLYICLITAKY